MRAYSKRITWAGYAIFLVLSLAAGFVGAEGLSRIVVPQCAPKSARSTDFWQFHPRYGWAHIPEKVGRFSSFGFDTEIKINQKGFRGSEVAYERSDKPRIVVLGDSFVWGFGVEESEMFTSVLKTLVPDVEIVNLGVNAYSTDQELLLYVEEGRKYSADLIILVVSDNDFTDNARSMVSHIYAKPLFSMNAGTVVLSDPIIQEPPFLKRVLVKSASRSYLLTCANRYLEVSRVEETRGYRRDEEKPFPRSYAQELTMNLILELHKQISNDGARMLVIFADGMLQAEEAASYLKPYDISSEVLDHYMNLSDATLHLPQDFHWNAKGHRLVADVISKRLSQQLKPSVAVSEQGK